MLEQLFGGLQEAFQNQGHNSDATQQSAQMVQNSFMEAIQQQIAQGNISQVMGMFNGQANEQTHGDIQNHIAGQLQQQGMSSQMIQQVMQQIVPMIMNNFMSSKTGNTQNGMDLLSMLGLGNNNNLSNIMNNFMQNNNQSNSNPQNNNEGLGGLINKLF